MLPRVAGKNTYEYLKDAHAADKSLPKPPTGKSNRSLTDFLLLPHEPTALKAVAMLKHDQNKFYAVFENVEAALIVRRVDANKV